MLPRVKPIDIETVRLGEHGRVPPGGRQRDHDEVTAAELGRAEPDIVGSEPVHYRRGRFQPERLLDGGRYQGRVGEDEGELIGVGQQVQHGVGDHALGGLDPAEHQDRRVGDRLGLRQRPGHLGQQR